jgi:hypothetical protein
LSLAGGEKLAGREEHKRLPAAALCRCLLVFPKLDPKCGGQARGLAALDSERGGDCDDDTAWWCLLDRFLSLSLSRLGMPPNPTRS